MTRRGWLAVGLAALACGSRGLAKPKKWDLLFDGPPIGDRCEIGAMSGGQRFRDPRDTRHTDWLLIDEPAVMIDPRPDIGPPDPMQNWPIAVGRRAVDLTNGRLVQWGWDDIVIRMA